MASGVREGGSWLIDNRQTDRQRSATCYEVVSARDSIKQCRRTEGLQMMGTGCNLKQVSQESLTINRMVEEA